MLFNTLLLAHLHTLPGVASSVSSEKLASPRILSVFRFTGLRKTQEIQSGAAPYMLSFWGLAHLLSVLLYLWSEAVTGTSEQSKGRFHTRNGPRFSPLALVFPPRTAHPPGPQVRGSQERICLVSQFCSWKGSTPSW